MIDYIITDGLIINWEPGYEGHGSVNYYITSKENRVDSEMILDDETVIFKTHYRGVNMFPTYFDNPTIIA